MTALPAMLVLTCAALLLVLAIVAVAVGRSPSGTLIIYGASFVLALVSLLAGVTQLLGGGPPTTIALPLGLPWIGA